MPEYLGLDTSNYTTSTARLWPEGVRQEKQFPIKAVRDYDNLELKAVIDVIATFCLADDTGALCDSFQTTRFGYSSSTVITVMPKNCFSAWLNAPETAENRPPLFPKNS